MGTGDYTLHGSIDDTDVDELQALQNKLWDCKEYARAYALQEPGLIVMRGHVICEQNFFEHWWCKTPSGVIVDATSIVPNGANYVALPTDEQSLMYSMCDARVGPCQERPRCAWCRARQGLERKGLKLASPRAAVHIAMLHVTCNRLYTENESLRKQLRDSGLTPDTDFEASE